MIAALTLSGIFVELRDFSKKDWSTLKESLARKLSTLSIFIIQQSTLTLTIELYYKNFRKLEFIID